MKLIITIAFGALPTRCRYNLSDFSTVLCHVSLATVTLLRLTTNTRQLEDQRSETYRDIYRKEMEQQDWPVCMLFTRRV